MNKIVTIKAKTCSKCRKLKSVMDFYRDKGRDDGVEGICKLCSRIKGRNRNRSEYKKKYYAVEEHKKKYALSIKKYIKNYPERQKARTLAQKHIPIDELVFCEMCKNTGVKLHRHHPDYSKPLQVMILCTKCHGLQHRKNE